MKTLITKRLIIRPFCIEDAEPYFEVVSDSEVMRYIDWGPLSKIEEAQSYINTVLKKYPIGFLEWVIEKDGEVIGSIIVYENDHSFLKEIAYIIKKSQWRKGYATETVSSVTDYLLQSGKAKCVYAKHVIENSASGTVLKKCGFLCMGIEKNAFLDKEGNRHDCIRYLKSY